MTSFLVEGLYIFGESSLTLYVVPTSLAITDGVLNNNSLLVTS